MKLFIRRKKNEAAISTSLEEKRAVGPFEKKEVKEIAKAYEETHVLERLEFLITIVNEGQDGAIVKILNDNSVSVAFSSHGCTLRGF